jgi:hypothetical protein
MLVPITKYTSKLAAVIITQACPALDPKDIDILRKDAPRYLRQVQMNIKLDKDPLKDLSDTEKRILLAYTVFLRQNLTIGEGDRANEEDAAKILHGKVYKGKKEKDDLKEELEKQLEKIGVIKE